MTQKQTKTIVKKPSNINRRRKGKAIKRKGPKDK